jgi:hypothetical protein
MKRLVRLTEGDLHRIIKESVVTILNEVDGYEETMEKANNFFDNSTFGGKMRRLFSPNKAKQFDRIHNNAEERFDDAEHSYWDNFYDNFPTAADPYARPSEEDIEKLNYDRGIMKKYNLGRRGYRNKYI